MVLYKISGSAKVGNDLLIFQFFKRKENSRIVKKGLNRAKKYPKVDQNWPKLSKIKKGQFTQSAFFINALLCLVD